MNINSIIKSKYPTIVTSFYDVYKLQNNKDIEEFNCRKGRKKLENYLELASNFILTLSYPILLFIDNNEYGDIVEDFVNKHPNNNKNIIIYRESFEKTHFYSYLDKLTELQTKFHIINGDIKHETPHYIIINNNKFHFMEKAIEKNPFGSSHFIWIDFGINHVAKSPEKIHEWIGKVPDKIKQLCINPYIEKNDPKTFFQKIYHHTAGGLFSGSAEYMKEYIRLFKQKVDEVFSQDWYQIDEAIMTMVQRENPHLFEYFYGDYEGILANYEYPNNSILLILVMLYKVLNNAECFHWTLHILNYLEPYFNIKENQTGEHLYYFLEVNILLNYYSCNRCLKENIIQIIRSKIEIQDENNPDYVLIKGLIEKHNDHLKKYENISLLGCDFL
jgi:hypothetical protein